MQCQLLFRPKEFDKEPENLCYVLDMLSLQVVPYFPGLSSSCSWHQFLNTKGKISRKHACEGRTISTCYTCHGLSCSKQGEHGSCIFVAKVMSLAKSSLIPMSSFPYCGLTATCNKRGYELPW